MGSFPEAELVTARSEAELLAAGLNVLKIKYSTYSMDALHYGCSVMVLLEYQNHHYRAKRDFIFKQVEPTTQGCVEVEDGPMAEYHGLHRLLWSWREYDPKSILQYSALYDMDDYRVLNGITMAELIQSLQGTRRTLAIN